MPDDASAHQLSDAENHVKMRSFLDSSRDVAQPRAIPYSRQRVHASLRASDRHAVDVGVAS